ncbi:MAG TPA: bifunctional diaminohydroxyphosphoribosylaminopyrimidine deaminase/5-amino-6-(5-phosphoribosylamino)uracil reductase RibD, partial [Desulfosalsimonadaceae bacterium]|nr:bifunctional diaminohydroxyphosphoribosylaminopyrimidine deaminase/5-amino-6-(5-phosphoribosylamino)uracil reductase RibD [Desulfosalsimonadaceae bacterium]
TLYVTLEPCNHYGRTPPCTEKIIAAGIRRVVIAAMDPNPAVTGGGARYLEENGISVTYAVCEEEAERQNEAFFKFTRTGRPFVILKSAATLDGRTSARTGDSKWVTGPASRHFVHQLRHACDAIMVGVDTVKADNPGLTTRLEGEKGVDPHRIILDSRLSIPEDAKVLQLNSASDTFIVFHEAADREKPERLVAKGARLLQAPLQDGMIDIAAVMEILGGQNITSLLIEGGSRVMGSAIRSGIADKICFFYAPKILGGDDGAAICSGPGPERMAGSIAIVDISVKRFEDDVLISGYISYPSCCEQ